VAADPSVASAAGPDRTQANPMSERDEALERSLAACRPWTHDEAKVYAMYALGDLLVELMKSPPPRKPRWWRRF
jgi:hypothetical protein